MRRMVPRLTALLTMCVAVAAPTSSIVADDVVVIPIRAAQTVVLWTLGAPLHTVHGNFPIEDTSLRLDSRTNEIMGDVRFDLAGGASGNAKRDANMRNDVLETAKYPVAVFTARSLTGRVVPNGPSHVTLAGSLLIHGASHDLTLPLDVESRDGRIERAETRLTIPYVAWGMHDPSVFMLRVSDHVDVDVRVTAQPSLR